MKDIINAGEGPIEISDAPLEVFGTTSAGWMALAAQLKMMRVVELVYHLAAPEYPRVVKPKIWIGNSDEVNAYCDYNKCRIIVLRGLLERISNLIRRRGTDRNLANWPTESKGNPAQVRAGVWRQAIGFLTLHELYHMWHSHYAWKQRYAFDRQGKLIQRAGTAGGNGLSGENVEFYHDGLTAEELQSSLTQQAMEMDADASAVCMLINCMRYEYDALTGQGMIIDRLEYARDQIALFGGAITVVFEVLYHMNEIGFDRLGAIDLCAMTHPIPAIRRDYAEEVMGGMLFRYFERDEVERIQGDYMMASNLMELDEEQEPDWRSVYYFLAYTKKCQDHIVRVKQRMIDMYETEKALALGNMPDKLEEADLPYPAGAVMFTDDGKSLRGWD